MGRFVPTRAELLAAARDYALMTAGALVIAVSVDMFLAPNRVVAGGVTGIGMLTHYTLGWPVGVVTLVLNLPLFAAGWRWGGGAAFLWRTIYATTVMSFGIDLVAPFVTPVQGDPLIYTLFGGLLDGFGVGLVLRGRGTTGGTDIVAQLLYRLRRVSFGQVFLVVNTTIVLAAAWFVGLVPALYGVIVNIVVSRTVDAVNEGLSYARAATIVSSRADEVRAAINAKLGRGVTVLSATGGFTGEPRTMLYAVVARSQVTHLRRLVAAIDPEAFVVIAEAHDVLGQGFRPLAE